MNKASVHAPSLFRLVILVTSIVVAMFCITVLMGLLFMPKELMTNIPLGDMKFLMPMALGTLCSSAILGRYVYTYKARFKEITEKNPV